VSRPAPHGLTRAAIARRRRGRAAPLAAGSRRPCVAAALGALVIAAAGLPAAGCAGPGLPLDEVTDAPIALVWWDATTARKRQDLIDRLSGESAALAPSREGVARLESLAEVVTGASGAGSSSALQLRQYPGRIVLLHPRTLEIEAFPAAPPNARPLAWSPDRRHLLFNSSHQDGGRSQLYEFDRDTGQVFKLTHGPAHHLEGDYGPGARLLISWVRLGPDEKLAGLDVRTPTGGMAERLLDGIYPSTPRWSPAGDSYVYVEADNTGGRRDASVIVRKPIEPGARRDALARGREPVYTPDGSTIVYASQTASGWQLRRMRADGSGRASLGESVRDERWPAVSPDGRHVAYISNQAGFDQLYIRRMDGSGDRILLDEGAVAFPVW